MQDAVGCCDVEETFVDVFQQCRIIGEHLCYALCVKLVPGDILSGQTVDALDVGAFLGGDVEATLEGLGFDFDSDAIGLCHLGREPDEGDGERKLLAGGSLLEQLKGVQPTGSIRDALDEGVRA